MFTHLVCVQCNSVTYHFTCCLLFRFNIYWILMILNYISYLLLCHLLISITICKGIIIYYCHCHFAGNDFKWSLKTGGSSRMDCCILSLVSTMSMIQSFFTSELGLLWSSISTQVTYQSLFPAWEPTTISLNPLETDGAESESKEKGELSPAE